MATIRTRDRLAGRREAFNEYVGDPTADGPKRKMPEADAFGCKL